MHIVYSFALYDFFSMREHEFDGCQIVRKFQAQASCLFQLPRDNFLYSRPQFSTRKRGRKKGHRTHLKVEIRTKLWVIQSLSQEREGERGIRTHMNVKNPMQTLGKMPEERKRAHDYMHFSQFQDYPRTVC